MGERPDQPSSFSVGATSTSRTKPLAHSHSLRSGRVSEPGNAYLVTTCTHDRQPSFRDLAAGKVILTSLRHLHDAGRVTSHASVVMPDHLHWLFTLRTGSLSGLMQSLKTYTAKQLTVLGLPTPIWQEGFHDHALRSEEDLRDTARYLLANPVRAGLVATVTAYPLLDCQWGLEP